MMDSLTNRLSVLIDQVAENQIEELINHDRMQKERLMMEREQRAKMKISSKKAEDMIYLMKHQPRVGNRDSLISNSISTIAKQNDNQKSSSKPEGRDGGKWGEGMGGRGEGCEGGRGRTERARRERGERGAVRRVYQFSYHSIGYSLACMLAQGLLILHIWPDPSLSPPISENQTCPGSLLAPARC